MAFEYNCGVGVQNVENLKLVIPVSGVGYINVPGRELQDLFCWPHSTVWVRLHLEQLRRQAIVRVLRSWRDVNLQLG